MNKDQIPAFIQAVSRFRERHRAATAEKIRGRLLPKYQDQWDSLNLPNALLLLPAKTLRARITSKLISARTPHAS